MYFEDTILDYIELVRNSVPDAVEVFTKGNCGPFALMLLKTFPGGEILNNVNHTVYEYNGEMYDITGKISYEKLKNDSLYSGMIPIIEYGLDAAIIKLKPRYVKGT